MDTGEKLRDLRLNARRTLKQQSEIFGVSLNSIYRWEHNLSKPKKDVLKQIADFYGVNCEWLTDDGSGDENPSPYIESDIEGQLLKTFRLLPATERHKILGYIERIFVERRM